MHWLRKMGLLRGEIVKMEREEMAGVAGFEPAHADTKNRCLTAWLHPIIVISGRCPYFRMEDAPYTNFDAYAKGKNEKNAILSK